MPRRSQADIHPESPGANLEAIARSLGVAISTVSRALRNSPGIHPNTRLRIQSEAARLGYVMKRRDAGTGVQSPGPGVRHLLTLAQALNNASQQGYLSGISRAAQTHNVGVFSHHVSAGAAATVLDKAHQPAALRLPELEGIILIHRWPAEVVAELVKRWPVVSIVHRYPGLPVDLVGMDDEVNLKALIAHLRAQGHERIGFFGYEPSFSWAQSRFACHVGALAAAGLEYDPANVVPVSMAAAGSHTAPDCAEVLPLVRARVKAGVRAWVASSYVLAQGLVQGLQTGGRRVPADVVVAGYHGGMRLHQAGVIHPTSIEVDDEALGAAAVHLLHHRALRSVPAPLVLLLPGHLVQGDTTLPTAGV